MCQSPSPSVEYNTHAIRGLIAAAFTDEDFGTFCYDYFPDIYRKFSLGMTYPHKAHLLIEYCGQTDSFDHLLRLVKEINPERYAQYDEALHHTIETTAAGPAESSGQFPRYLVLLLIWVVLSSLYWSFAFDRLALEVGGWYKAWYFREFSLPNELHGFSDGYYKHASWSTNLSALSGTLIAASICLCLYIRGVRLRHVLVWFALIIILFPWGILSFWPFHFDPYGPAWQQFIGSRDYSLWAMAVIVVIGASFYIVREWRHKTYPLFKDLYSLLHKQAPQVFTLAIIGSLLFPFIAGLYLYFMGYLMGKYHGYSAIWEGKMNVRWARVDERWWIFVARTDDELNILYDREGGKGRFFADSEIDELDGPVTQYPNPE